MFVQLELITCFDIFFAEANQDSRSDFALWVAHWYDETPNLTFLATGRAWAMLNRTPILAVSWAYMRICIEYSFVKAVTNIGSFVIIEVQCEECCSRNTWCRPLLPGWIWTVFDVIQ